MNQQRWTITRDITLFTSGLLGTAHEIMLTNGERPYVLILLAAMMGLPWALYKDGRSGLLKSVLKGLEESEPKDEKS